MVWCRPWRKTFEDIGVRRYQLRGSRYFVVCCAMLTTASARWTHSVDKQVLIWTISALFHLTTQSHSKWTKKQQWIASKPNASGPLRPDIFNFIYSFIKINDTRTPEPLMLSEVHINTQKHKYITVWKVWLDWRAGRPIYSQSLLLTRKFEIR